jgi:FkbM family methyltransferase
MSVSDVCFHGSQGHRNLRVVFKGLIKRSLARLGFYLERFPRTNTLDAQLLYLLNALRINCVLDVGGHQGEYGLQLRALGYQGRIVSFEPVTENFAILAGHCARDKRWEAHQFALGRVECTEAINVYSGSTFNSFLTPSAYGSSQFEPKMHLIRKESVTVRRLDILLDECLANLDKPRVLLKMDTQGYDLQVLEGTGKRLDEIVAIQTELSVQPIYEQMSTELTAAIDEMRRRGFELSGMYPVGWDPADGLRVVEFDCLMCRRQN